MAAYEEISIYDVPQVWAGQLAQGRLGVGTAKDALLNRDALSPRDRLQVSQLVAERTGMGKFGEGILDVATNPFVWMMVLAHNPAGRSAIRQYGTIQAVKKGASAYQKNFSGWLHNWVMGVNEALMGTEGPTTAGLLVERMRTMGQRAYSEMATAELRAVAAINERIRMDTGKPGRLKALEFRGLQKKSPEYEELSRFQRTLAAHASKEGQVLTQRVKKSKVPVYEVMEDGKTVELFADDDTGTRLRRFVQEVERAKEQAAAGGPVRKFREGDVEITTEIHERLGRLDPGLLAEELARYGGVPEEFIGAAADARRMVMWKALGDEGKLPVSQNQQGVHETSVRDQDGTVVPFVVDERKLFRFAKRLRGEAAAKAANDKDSFALREMESREILEAIVGPSLVDDLRHRIDPLLGSKTWTQRTAKQLAEAVTPSGWADDLWMPRDTVDVVAFTGADGRRVVPRMTLSQFQVGGGGGDASIHNIQGGVTGRVFSRRAAEIPLHPDDLEAMERVRPGILTDKGRKHVEEVRAKARTAWEKGDGQVTQAYRLDYLSGHRTYMDQMIRFAALNSPIDQSVINAELTHSRHWYNEHGEVLRPGAKVLGPGDIEDGVWETHNDRLLALESDFERMRYTEGYSLWDQMERMTARMDAPWQSFVRTTALPTAINRGRVSPLMSYANSQLAKARAKGFAGSPMGRFIGEHGGEAGKRFVGHLREVADTAGIVAPVQFGPGIARYLYVTHLGANLSSVMLNLTQPLLMAAAVGDPGVVAKAYAAAFRDLGSYAKERLKHGPRSFVTGISETDKMALIHKTMPLTRVGPVGDERNVVGIEPDFYRVVDEYAANRTHKGVVARVEDILMGAFEKSEWLNRLVAGHIAEGMHAKWGPTAGNAFTASPWERVADDAKWLVDFTQFAANPMNRPQWLQKGVFSNPVTKVFLTFPARMLTGAFHVFPSMEGSSLPHFWARAIGLSAMTHELTKNFLDVDISRGLFFDASTDLFNFEDIVTGEDPIASKVAAVNLPMTLIKGVALDDRKALANTFARLLPAGVAMSRVAGILPDARGSLAAPVGALQNGYVDWGDAAVNEEGTTIYPTFTSEGRLVEYRTGPEIVLRGLGVDLGAWGEQGSLDHYLVVQGEKMKRMKHEVLRRLRAGDVSGAMRVKAEFEEEFADPKSGRRIPFTVSRQQLSSFLKSEDVGRSERILEGLPVEARGVYRQMVASSGYARNVAREGLLAENTARARANHRVGDEDLRGRLRVLEERLTSMQAPQAFSSFSG